MFYLLPTGLISSDRQILVLQKLRPESACLMCCGALFFFSVELILAPRKGLPGCLGVTVCIFKGTTYKFSLLQLTKTFTLHKGNFELYDFITRELWAPP